MIRDYIIKLGTIKTVIIITFIALLMAFAIVLGSAYIFTEYLNEPYNYKVVIMQIFLTVGLIAPSIGWIVIQSYMHNYELENHFNQLSRYDELTGLMNRRAFFEEFDRIMLETPQQPFSLTILDLDFFKQVNDQYGHIAGDDVLRTFAKRLGDLCTQYQGYACRMGGEEFLVMLPNTGIDRARAFDNELRKSLQNQPIQLGKNSHVIQYSAGVFHTQSIIQKINIDHIICSADNALYQAKQQGRNQTVEEVAESV